eukprot:COSAG02_NODE_8820_length_2432_cov_5.941706_3_plen_94_part_00
MAVRRWTEVVRCSGAAAVQLWCRTVVGGGADAEQLRNCGAAMQWCSCGAGASNTFTNIVEIYVNKGRVMTTGFSVANGPDDLGFAVFSRGGYV